MDDAISVHPDAESIGASYPGPATTAKPELFVSAVDPDETTARVRDVLASLGLIFDRGLPVQLAFSHQQGGMTAHELTPSEVVRLTHENARPWSWRASKGEREKVPVRLPNATGEMFLGWRSGWNLRPLNGIASAPLLRDDGAIRAHDGYDPESAMWCERIPDLAGMVPERPTRADAAAALLTLRRRFETFAFADARTLEPRNDGAAVVDVSAAPDADESGFLAALLTAVCRPSLDLAPALMVRAAPVSGAGTGKGLLVRCIAAIALGRQPHALTAGGTAEETEKRIGAVLMSGAPLLLLDNINAATFKSDALASAITERPASLRILGQSKMIEANAAAFIALTGNGLAVTEDLARRFIVVELDARTEDPEARRYSGDILRECHDQRAPLLAAALTIWRWGRQASPALPEGRALGSFGQWSRWVRDPLLALGCADPAERVAETKAKDTRRQAIAELFAAWWAAHGDAPVTASTLDPAVTELADPHKGTRQSLARRLQSLDGTRMAGFVLTREPSAGRWNAATYVLRQSRSGEPANRTHRTHPVADSIHPGAAVPMSPMNPITPVPAAEIGAREPVPPNGHAAEGDPLPFGVTVRLAEIPDDGSHPAAVLAEARAAGVTVRPGDPPGWISLCAATRPPDALVHRVAGCGRPLAALLDSAAR